MYKSSVLDDLVRECNRIATIVNNQLFDGSRKWYWIGDQLDLCDFEDTDVISLSDMCLIIEHNLSFEEYSAWSTYALDHSEEKINLRSWIMGYRPNNSRSTQKRS